MLEVPLSHPADRRPLIFHVIHHLVIGGMENGLVNLINHLPEDRFRHAVLCIEDFSDFRQRIRRPDIDVIALHRSKVGVHGIRRAIFTLCRERRPTLVHSRNQSGLDALLPSWLAGVPKRLHSEHGWDVDNLQGWKWKPALLRRLHSPLVDHYITVSRDLENHLASRVGIRPSRITQIYNGVDTRRFVPGPRQGADNLPAGFLDAQAVCFGLVGRVQPVKHHSSLLRAAESLLGRRPDLRVRLRIVIVGDGPLLPATRDLALALGLDGVVWFAGASSDVPHWLRSFDAFVLPSLNEGISNTILEAMATGLPVIASAVGGNVELVDGARSGQLFPAGDVAALAAALERYVDDGVLRQAHGVAARQAAVERFSLDAMIDRYRDVYENLCTRRKR